MHNTWQRNRGRGSLICIKGNFLLDRVNSVVCAKVRHTGTTWRSFSSLFVCNFVHYFSLIRLMSPEKAHLPNWEARNEYNGRYKKKIYCNSLDNEARIGVQSTWSIRRQLLFLVSCTRPDDKLCHSVRATQFWRFLVFNGSFLYHHLWPNTHKATPIIMSRHLKGLCKCGGVNPWRGYLPSMRNTEYCGLSEID